MGSEMCIRDRCWKLRTSSELLAASEKFSEELLFTESEHCYSINFAVLRLRERCCSSDVTGGMSCSSLTGDTASDLTAEADAPD